jgi:methionine aminopeptidase
MKVYIKKVMQIPEIPSEVELEAGTLRMLLDNLLRNAYFAKEVIDPKTGELTFDGLIQVQLNNVPYHSLPDSLDTELHDGDTLALSLVLIGGG